MCPLLVTDQIRGTFVMGSIRTDTEYASRDVKFVNWTVTRRDEEFEIKGFGVYRFKGDSDTGSHSLDLTLWIDRVGPQYFFSGWIPMSSSDRSVHIPVSLNGQYCRDTVITVDAEPVKNDSLLRYSLAADSTYQRGCSAPCACAVEKPRQLRGGFTLVPILEYGTFVEYGVPTANFSVQPVGDSEDEIEFAGSGTYTLIQGFAGPSHELELLLRRNDGECERFVSGLANTDPMFPAELAVVVDIVGQTCVDTVLSIHAVRRGSLIFEDDFECGDRGAWSASISP